MVAAMSIAADLARPSYREGVLLALMAPLCWSLGGVLVRLLSAPSWTVVFWRSAFLALALLLYLAWRGNVWRALRRTGLSGVVSGLLLGAAFSLYVIALQSTTVANALLIQGTTPVWATLLGWIVLREKVPSRSWAALAAVLAGIAIIALPEAGGGALLGDAAALGVAFVFAANLVVVRRAQGTDMVPAVLLGAAFSVAAAFLVGGMPLISVHDLALCALLGFVQLALGLILFTRGAQLIPAAEAGLIALLETVLGPLWVWLALGERPSGNALIGGAIIIGTLALNAVLGARAKA
jgi:DME family drug/metabolite transporter